jgi:hypothetical protein
LFEEAKTHNTTQVTVIDCRSAGVHDADFANALCIADEMTVGNNQSRYIFNLIDNRLTDKSIGLVHLLQQYTGVLYVVVLKNLFTPRRVKEFLNEHKSCRDKLIWLDKEDVASTVDHIVRNTHDLFYATYSDLLGAQIISIPDVEIESITEKLDTAEKYKYYYCPECYMATISEKEAINHAKMEGHQKSKSFDATSYWMYHSKIFRKINSKNFLRIVCSTNALRTNQYLSNEVYRALATIWIKSKYLQLVLQEDSDIPIDLSS